LTIQDSINDGTEAARLVPDVLKDRPGQLTPGLCLQGGVAATKIKVVRIQGTAKESTSKTQHCELLEYHEPELNNLETWRTNHKTGLWVQIQGLADLKKIDVALTKLGINNELIPFLTSTPQPSQIKLYGSSVLIVLHQLSVTTQNRTRLESSQIVLLLNEGILVSVEEGSEEAICQSILDLIRKNASQKDFAQLDNIMYYIVDEILDSYPPIFQQLSDYLDELEEHALRSQSPKILSQLSIIRSNLRKCRQQLIALQTDLIPLFHASHDLITPIASRGFRDVEKLVVRLLEFESSARQQISTVNETYMASASHQMNQIMKILAIVSTIFTPLTFIAGVYGMNFAHMPELEHRNGYQLSLLSMAALAISMVLLLWHRGWISMPRLSRR
jgi:magnesium transporter